MTEETELDRAIASVYGGAHEDFVRRRDSLVRELRSAGRREDASLVKGLRKPSRVAWALDMAARQSGEAFGTLDTAVAATLEAHATGGHVRDAIAGLRGAVREFAAHAARAAEDAGHPIAEAGLVNAVLAVLGNADAFSALRRGCLVDVPDAGGLDFLSSLPALPLPAVPHRAEPVQAAASPAPSAPDAAVEQAARDAQRQAREALSDARRRSEEGRRALRDAESKLRAGEDQLRQLEAEVRALRDQRDRAHEESEKAAARLLETERALADAEAQLERLNARTPSG